MRNIAAGAEAQKMIVEYEQPDGSVQVRGYMMSDGPIATATGVMLRGAHSKCFWVAKKREAKGDAVTGRVMTGAPTGYDIDQLVLTREDLDALGLTPEQARGRSTAHLSARVSALRELAELMGKGVGDVQVQEAFTATEHGGPYHHQHHHRLDTYQVIAHLEHAHGLRDTRLLGDVHAVHMREHATGAQQDIRERRAAEQEQEPSSRDWREQFTAELGEA